MNPCYCDLPSPGLLIKVPDFDGSCDTCGLAFSIRNVPGIYACDLPDRDGNRCHYFAITPQPCAGCGKPIDKLRVICTGVLNVTTEFADMDAKRHG